MPNAVDPRVTTLTSSPICGALGPPDASSPTAESSKATRRAPVIDTTRAILWPSCPWPAILSFRAMTLLVSM